jgi:hypothetical protein
MAETNGSDGSGDGKVGDSKSADSKSADGKESVRHATWVREHPRIDDSAFPEYPDEKQRRGSSRGAAPNGNPWRPVVGGEKPGRSTGDETGVVEPRDPVPPEGSHANPNHRWIRLIAGEDDRTLAEELRIALSSSKIVEGKSLVLEVTDGEACLRGSVEDAHEKGELERIMSSVGGVKTIRNELTVAR